VLGLQLGEVVGVDRVGVAARNDCLGVFANWPHERCQHEGQHGGGQNGKSDPKEHER
jgi:hypothetical protein